MIFWHWMKRYGRRLKSASRPRSPHRTSLVLETLEQKCLPSSLPVGNLPVSVATADFNGDGNLDLVVVNHEAPGTPGSVSVLLGNGDGSFQEPIDIPVSDKPFGVAVGDFNGDGIPDLVVTDAGDSTRTTLNVLLGNGDGTFQSPQPYTVGRDPRAVAVGDVNGDGIPDIVTATMFDGNISVLLGNGDGTFRGPINTLISGGPVALALGDINGDGQLDIVTTTVSFGQVPGQVQVALGNGDGTFRVSGEFDIGFGERDLQAKAVVLGDFNGDGNLDIATANTSDVRGTISVLLGNGDGTFGTFFRFTDGSRDSQPADLVVGDFNGDGIPDLLTTNVGSSGTASSVNVLLGLGDGAFGPPIQSGFGAGANAVAVGDLNGDGILDVATVDSNANTVSVLLGVGDGTFTQDPIPTIARQVNDPTGRITFPAVDRGAGNLDLILLTSQLGSVTILPGHGDGAFGPPQFVNRSADPEDGVTSVAWADLRSIDALDLVVSVLTSSAVTP